jgi:putative ubiquitin-RnfH superfamily antitoxin RatB of RatAB toxin-antitoxin module
LAQDGKRSALTVGRAAVQDLHLAEGHDVKRIARISGLEQNFPGFQLTVGDAVQDRLDLYTNPSDEDESTPSGNRVVDRR